MFIELLQNPDSALQICLNNAESTANPEFSSKPRESDIFLPSTNLSQILDFHFLVIFTIIHIRSLQFAQSSGANLRL